MTQCFEEWRDGARVLFDQASGARVDHADHVVLASGRGDAIAAPCAVAQPVKPMMDEVRFGAQRADLMALRGLLAQGLGGAEAGARWDGVVVLAGESTVWLHVSAGEVISLHRAASVALARAMAPILPEPNAISETVDAVMARPERLALMAASAHAGEVWGAAIGAELAASKPYWLGQEVVLLADGPLADLYSEAFLRAGIWMRCLGRDAMAYAGFMDCYQEVAS